MQITPALGRLKQEDHELKASLGVCRDCLKRRWRRRRRKN
jgi:hypothetical protein